MLEKRQIELLKHCHLDTSWLKQNFSQLLVLSKHGTMEEIREECSIFAKIRKHRVSRGNDCFTIKSAISKNNQYPRRNDLLSFTKTYTSISTKPVHLACKSFKSSYKE